MISFQAERFSGPLYAELLPLLHLHKEEIAHYPDIALDVDLSVYINALNNGMLRVFTARDEGALVGYSVFFVRKAPHYAGSLQAVQDVLFVLPQYRGGTGKRLIEFCDEQLRAEGVQVVTQHVKLAHNFGPLLERMGYVAIETIYSKRLDRPEE